MPRDQATSNPAVAILEPGYASYETEHAILADLNVAVAAIGADQDPVSGLKALDPMAILVRERAVTAEVLAACPNLKVVVRYGVGVDNIDIALCTRRGIQIANVPDYGADIEVSEHAIALYLAVQRRIVSRDAEVRQGKWGIGQRATIPGRFGKTVGLVGCGRIGLAAAEKFRALGFARVLAVDPQLDPMVAQKAGIEVTTLEAVCAHSDVISLHAPLTPETRNIIGPREFALMQPGTIIVNVSRGGLVDERALAQALATNAIFGAGIDVFETEPIRPDTPLLAVPNTVLSDHAGWYSERSVEELQRRAAEEVHRVLSGHPPRNWVNPW